MQTIRDSGSRSQEVLLGYVIQTSLPQGGPAPCLALRDGVAPILGGESVSQ